VAAVGAEQNVGKLHTICEDLGKREVEAWLQEHQKADAAIKQKVRDADKFFEGRSFEAFGGPSFSWAILNYGRITNNVRVQDAEYQALTGIVELAS